MRSDAQWILITPNSLIGILVIGSDVLVSLRRPDRNGKRQAQIQKKSGLGEFTAKHGDIVFLRTFEKALEVGMKQLGYGFGEHNDKCSSLRCDGVCWWFS